jgi:hypothetical protein
MLRGLIAILLIAFAALAVRAEMPAPADAQEFRRIISEQLEAFRADDGARAYSFAAPEIKRLFPSVDIFMSMVRNGYRPVYRSSEVEFGEIITDPLGRPAQRVGLTGPDGKRYEALYSMERQPDGSWRIIGCTLLEVPGLDA